jgi:sugar lactone lactonase YvrE
VPDGICLDADGAVWMASPISHQVVRVAEGGEVLAEVRTSDERQPFACMLGGDDGRTLFVCTAFESEPEECRQRLAGRIEAIDVDVPHAGLP